MHQRSTVDQLIRDLSVATDNGRQERAIRHTFAAPMAVMVYLKARRAG